MRRAHLLPFTDLDLNSFRRIDYTAQLPQGKKEENRDQMPFLTSYPTRQIKRI